MRLAITTMLLCCLGLVSAADPPSKPDDISPEGRKAAESYVNGAKARLLIGLEEDAGEVRKHKAESLAIPGLVKLFKDDNELIRLSAVQRIGLLGPAARTAVPDLIEATKDKAAAVSSSALASLCLLAPLPKDKTAFVVEAWLRSKPDVFGRETVNLSRLGPDAIPALVKVISGSDDTARLRVLSAMSDMFSDFNFGPEALEAVPEYVKLMQRKEERVVYFSICSLARVGPDTIPDLVKALSHPNAEVRRIAQLQLAVLYRPADRTAAIPALIAMVKDPEEGLRVDAARALGDYGPAAKSAIPALIEATRQKSPMYLASSACQALGEIDPQATESLTVLIERLKADGDARESAAAALWHAGPKAKDAAAPLREVIDGNKDRKHLELRLLAIGALVAVDRDAAKKDVPALRAALEDDWVLRYRAIPTAATFLALEPDNKEAKAILKRFVDGGSAYERVPAAEALVKSGADAKPLATQMFEALTPDKPIASFEARVGYAQMARFIYKVDPSKSEALVKLFGPVVGDRFFDSRLRAEVADLLADIGAKDGVSAALVAGLTTYTPMVTTAVTRALVKIGAPAVPDLVKALSSERAGVRYQAAKVLAEIGPKASAAVPALRTLLKDPYPFVASAGDSALAKIQPK